MGYVKIAVMQYWGYLQSSSIKRLNIPWILFIIINLKVHSWYDMTLWLCKFTQNNATTIDLDSELWVLIFYTHDYYFCIIKGAQINKYEALLDE